MEVLGKTLDGVNLDAPPDPGASGPAPRKSPKPLRDLILPLTTEGLRETPPRRNYLLSVAGTGKGVLVRGRVGLIAARGGTGKTIALAQLAVAVATGSPWFGSLGWSVQHGRVLLVLAEEDGPEVLRRLHNAIRAADIIGDESLELVASNVTSLPLCGHSAALTLETDEDTGELPETPRVEELRQLLREAVEAGRPYSVVILDPLSRFAGADVEKDNAAATRFVQTVETLTSIECGSPTVLLSHHLRKSSKDDDGETADPIRGASGLVDGVRWAAILERMKRIEGAADLVRLRVVKTNYAPDPGPLMLCRPIDQHGCLRVAHSEEVSGYEERVKTARPKRVTRETKVEQLCERILAELKIKPGTGSELATRLKARKELVCDACRILENDGFIRREAGPRSPWCLTEDSSGNGSGNDPNPGSDSSPGSRPPTGAEPRNDLYADDLKQDEETPSAGGES